MVCLSSVGSSGTSIDRAVDNVGRDGRYKVDEPSSVCPRKALSTWITMAPIFIDSLASLASFLDDLPDCKGQPPSLYIDLEGNNVSRHGTLSIITILVRPQNKIYLIDVTSLGRDTFTTKSTNKNLALKDVLESDSIIKVFFDIRNDSDALFGLHNIYVQNIEDLQLFEFASRTFSKRCVHGLKKCIETDLNLPYSEKQEWLRAKEKVQGRFRSGNFAAFDERPMSGEMIQYCAQDVVYMPRLREMYLNRLCDTWYLKIMVETRARIRLSQCPDFNGKGRHMALGPSG